MRPSPSAASIAALAVLAAAFAFQPQAATAEPARSWLASTGGERPIFSATERRILQGVLDQLQPAPGPRARQPGPPGRRGLPPGIAKNLQRGQPLPPGIAKRYLSPDVRRLLPPRERYEVVLIDDDAYLIGRATGVIVDILLRN